MEAFTYWAQIKSMRKKSSPITQKEYGIFIGGGGLKAIRRVQDECLEEGLCFPIDSVPKRFERFYSNLNLLWLQRNLTFVFNSRLAELGAKWRLMNVPIRHPIPQEWHTPFLISDFLVQSWISHKTWMALLYKKAMQSCASIICLILKLHFSSKVTFHSGARPNPLVWTIYSGGNMLSTDTNDGFTFGNWLKSRPEFAKSNIIFYNEIPRAKYNWRNSRTLDFDFSDLRIKKGAGLKLTLDLFYIIGFGLFKAFQGKPSFLSLGSELALALIAESVQVEQLPDYFFFDEAAGILRPLWSYVVEERGKQVIYVFFSNSVVPKLSDEPQRSLFLYSRASWSNYWTTSAYQSDLLAERTKLDKSCLKIVGYPWRIDYLIDFPREPKTKVAVFDYESHRGYFGISTINDVGYHDHRKDVLFLSDLFKLASELGFLLIHKTKRVLPEEKRTTEYKNLLCNLDSSPNYVQVNPKVSAHHLSLESDLVISLPFTSTAYLAHELGKPSIFYDPIGELKSNDPALSNIPLFQSIDLLKAFVRKIIQV